MICSENIYFKEDIYLKIILIPVCYGDRWVLTETEAKIQKKIPHNISVRELNAGLLKTC